MDCGVCSCVTSGSFRIFALWRKVWALLSLRWDGTPTAKTCFVPFPVPFYVLLLPLVSLSSLGYWDVSISGFLVVQTQAISYAKAISNWVKRSQKEASGGLACLPELFSVLTLATWEQVVLLFFCCFVFLVQIIQWAFCIRQSGIFCNSICDCLFAGWFCNSNLLHMLHH